MKLLRLFFITTNILLILGLLLGFIRQFVAPDQGSLLTLFSLLYPYLIIALSIMLFVLVSLRSKWFWASLITLVLTSGSTVRQIGFHFQPPTPSDTMVYTITTLNVKDNFSYNGLDQIPAFLNDFKNHKPSFLLLQEITENTARKVSQSLNYPHSSTKHKKITKGQLAIFSDYPMKVIKSVRNVEDRIIGLVAEIDLPESTIRVINLHLHTNAVTIRAGNFTAESISRKEGFNAFKDMIRTYGISASLRMDEIDLIQKEIAASKHPVIVAGDINDTPFSPVYLKLKQNLQDSFTKGGLGFAQTYNGLALPLKIDHIFVDSNFYIFNTKINKITYSDHNPMRTSFSLKN